MTLREFLDSLDDYFYRNYPINIYSKQNGIVGHIYHGKELIPENVLKYKYQGLNIEPNRRVKNAHNILIIIVE